MGAIIGTAGWSVPAKDVEALGGEGSALERYAGRFAGVEINSSFHRSHRVSTWARWAESVPAAFRFAVKMPKAISHERKLAGCADLVDAFLDEVGPLGGRLGVLLLQLPPKLGFDPALAEAFLEPLAARAPAPIACEPRHPSWFDPESEALLSRLGIARVAADPAVVAAAARPGGWSGLSYWRLHGSPAMYRSSYDSARLDNYARLIRAELRSGRSVWCMFDNTAASAATGNALDLMARL